MDNQTGLLDFVLSLSLDIVLKILCAVFVVGGVGRGVR